MKCVMIFLVLSLVLLMAEPGEAFFKSIWRGGKAAFRGARTGWRDYRHNRRLEKIARYEKRQRANQDGGQQDYLSRIRSRLSHEDAQNRSSFFACSWK